MPKQHFFLMQCKPGYEEEYKKRHLAVYPELEAALKEAGISNYSIFMDGKQLYAYLETDDFNRSMKLLAEHPANQRWQAYMSDIMVTDQDGTWMKVIKEQAYYLS
jgi:L-rhamnose mutarotase